MKEQKSTQRGLGMHVQLAGLFYSNTAEATRQLEDAGMELQTQNCVPTSATRTANLTWGCVPNLSHSWQSPVLAQGNTLTGTPVPGWTADSTLNTETRKGLSFIEMVQKWRRPSFPTCHHSQQGSRGEGRGLERSQLRGKAPYRHKVTAAQSEPHK